jgi:Uri superfamily endonuclease
MLEKLFESLDEKVFTNELKESLQAQFNEAVNIKAALLAEERIEEEIDALNDKSEQHINFLNEKAEQHINFLDEKSEQHINFLDEKSKQHIDFLNEKADSYVEMKQTEMLNSLDAYLDRVVNEFMLEAKASLDASLKSEKADMIIEAFDAMLTATGVKVADIVEARDESSLDNKLEESINKHDALIDEIISLKEENHKLIKMGIIAEMSEGLSIVEAERFKRLAKLVEFTKDAAFVGKLETIKESVQSSSSRDRTERSDHSERSDRADQYEQRLREPSQKENDVNVPSWAHLV